MPESALDAAPRLTRIPKDFTLGQGTGPMSTQTKQWLVCALCCVVVASGRSETSIISFDDLSPGNDWLLASNGYGGLRWYYFGVLDGTLRPATEGYRMGVISSNNVA